MAVPWRSANETVVTNGTCIFASLRTFHIQSIGKTLTKSYASPIWRRHEAIARPHRRATSSLVIAMVGRGDGRSWRWQDDASAADSTEFLSRQGGAAAECFKLQCGDFAAHRRHAAICTGDDFLRGNIFCRFADHRGDFLWRFDPIGGDIDGADQHIFAVEEL